MRMSRRRRCCGRRLGDHRQHHGDRWTMRRSPALRSTRPLSSNRTIVTTAVTPRRAVLASHGSDRIQRETLSNNDASTGTGQNITVAGAITVSTDTGTTSAFLGTGATINARHRRRTVSAASVDVVPLTSDGDFTGSGTTGVGVAVAINVADRPTGLYHGYGRRYGGHARRCGSGAVSRAASPPPRPRAWAIPSNVGVAGSLASTSRARPRGLSGQNAMLT